MLIKGMRAHVAAHGCCILCLLELDCRIQLRGMGGGASSCLFMIDLTGPVSRRERTTPGPASGMNPMRDMT